MTRISRASLIIAFFFGIDKILGLARQVLFNRHFDAAQRDIFFVSNNIPDLLSALISGGALSVALIPVLTEYLDRDGRRATWELFSRIANLAFVVTAIVALVIILLADVLVRYLIAPGFDDPAKWMLTANLMRLDLLAILIFALSGMAMAGLQANQHFLLPALSPGLYNIGQILGILLLAPHFGIYGMVMGVILGACLHLAIQIPGLLRFGFRWTPRIDLQHPGVQRVLKLMGPRMLAMLSLHIYFLARDQFATYLGEGSVSALNNGWFIQQVPETLIGTAIAIALLPSLAEHLVHGDPEAFRQTVNRALRAMLALTLPVAALLIVGVRPLIEVAFQFKPGETDLAVWATRAFLLGLMGHTWLEVAVRSFYAHGDAITPLKAALVQIFAFLCLASLARYTIGVAGIALSDTLTFTGQALLLLFILNRRFPQALEVRSTLQRAGLGAMLGMLAAIGLMQVLPLPALFAALVAMAIGGLISLPFIWPEVNSLVRL
jgi:putative peptidoglycan lipid II flippase